MAPLQGIFVMSTDSGQSVTFTPGTSSKAPQTLNICLAKADNRDAGIVDLARIRFDEGVGLEKFMLNPSHTKIYIPQDGKDYAVVNMGGDAARHVSTMDVNFKATEDGRYMITVNPEGLEMEYLHLLDNLTGVDVDLLALRQAQGPASYTFTAKATDYESRFKLVFSASEDADGGNDFPFAYYANGEIIVTCDVGDAFNAALQVIDAMGRVVRAVGLSQCGSRTTTTGMAPGVYVLRLINGDMVKTQKIIIQ